MTVDCRSELGETNAVELGCSKTMELHLSAICGGWPLLAGMCAHSSSWVDIAAGSKGKPIIASEAAILRMMPGGKDVESGQLDWEDPDRKRKPQANRDKRAAKKKRIQEELQELRRLKSGAKGDHGGKGKEKGRRKLKTWRPLCFSWASSTPPCGSLGPGAECACAVKRAHMCRICLSPSHQDKRIAPADNPSLVRNERGTDCLEELVIQSRRVTRMV